MTRPLILLGVRRSGTTLLRVILDRSPGIAIPDESYFVPQLAHRHGKTVDSGHFLDDVRRLPTVAEWGLSAAEIEQRLRPGMTCGEAIGALFDAYAARHGKPRWGDKTPMYMQHLPLLERLFPDALYVHLIRDGRDAAVSFLQMPDGVVTETWAHPRDIRGFACQWRTEVADARALGHRVGESRCLEVRYEELVATPSSVVRSICAFAGLPFEPEMLDYAGAVDVSSKPHQQRLRNPPTAGVRNWRTEMNTEGVREFEEVGGDLLHALGYELRDPSLVETSVAARLRLRSYRARVSAWNAAGYAYQRSPLWKRAHPVHL